MGGKEEGPRYRQGRHRGRKGRWSEGSHIGKTPTMRRVNDSTDFSSHIPLGNLYEETSIRYCLDDPVVGIVRDLDPFPRHTGGVGSGPDESTRKSEDKELVSVTSITKR